MNKWTIESREKLISSLKGRHFSPKTEFKKGHKVPKAWRKKVSLATKGITYEQRYGKEIAKILKDRYSKNRLGNKNSFYGKKHTEKTLRKLRLQRLGTTYEELYGKDKAKVMRKRASFRQKLLMKKPSYLKKVSEAQRKSWEDGKRAENLSKKMKKLWKIPSYRRKFLSHKCVAGMKGKHHTKESLRKISIGNLGKKCSKATLKRMSLAHKGVKSYWFGKKQSKKTLEKRSKYMKLRWQNPEYRKKILSRKPSVETRKKIGSAHRKLWSNPQYARRMSKLFRFKPNKPETKIMQIIKLNKLPFEYTGNGKVWITSFNPDFLSKNQTHIIEVYGEYHHNIQKVRERDLRRKQTYRMLRYQLLVIWSLELKNPQKVTEKIVKFISD